MFQSQSVTPSQDCQLDLTHPLDQFSARILVLQTAGLYISEWNDHKQESKKAIFSKMTEFGKDEIYTFWRHGTQCFPWGMKFIQHLAYVDRQNFRKSMS